MMDDFVKTESKMIVDDPHQQDQDDVSWITPLGFKTKEHWYIDANNTNKFKCKHCGKIVMQQKGSTSNLHRHLRKCLGLDDEDSPAPGSFINNGEAVAKKSKLVGHVSRSRQTHEPRAAPVHSSPVIPCESVPAAVNVSIVRPVDRVQQSASPRAHAIATPVDIIQDNVNIKFHDSLLRMIVTTGAQYSLLDNAYFRELLQGNELPSPQRLAAYIVNAVKRLKSEMKRLVRTALPSASVCVYPLQDAHNHDHIIHVISGVIPERGKPAVPLTLAVEMVPVNDASGMMPDERRQMMCSIYDDYSLRNKSVFLSLGATSSSTHPETSAAISLAANVLPCFTDAISSIFDTLLPPRDKIDAAILSTISAEVDDIRAINELLNKVRDTLTMLLMFPDVISRHASLLITVRNAYEISPKSRDIVGNPYPDSVVVDSLPNAGIRHMMMMCISCVTYDDLRMVSHMARVPESKMLSVSDWELVVDLVNLFDPLRKAFTFAEKAYASMCDLLDVIYAVRSKLSACLVKTELAAKMKIYLLSLYDTGMRDYINSDFAKIASYLNPSSRLQCNASAIRDVRNKLACLVDDVSELDAYDRAGHVSFRGLINEMRVSGPPSPETVGDGDMYSDVLDVVISTPYAGSNRLCRRDLVLAWWLAREPSLKRLAHLAMTYISCPVSTVPTLSLVMKMYNMLNEPHRSSCTSRVPGEMLLAFNDQTLPNVLWFSNAEAEN